MAGFRLTTKVQVSGWRFLLRRVEHAIVRRDTRMFDDPLQFYSRAVSVGIVIAVLVCLGAALLAYFKPLGKRGEDSLLVDRTTNQLYVVMPGSGLLHPVYNLTSARLVLGNPGTPNAVKSEELNRMPKGQPIGIPGAPYATPTASAPESMWTLCDMVTKVESVAPSIKTSVLVMPLVSDGAVGPMRPDQGLLVSFKDQDWLITKNGSGHSGDREADAHLGGTVQLPAERGPVAVARHRRWSPEYPWPAAESGDRVGVPDRHRRG
jgi:type VII secretion protein EccB